MSISLTIPIILLVICASDMHAGSAPGTPINIEEIFKGRCYEYQQVIRPDIFKSRKIDCSSLWQKFLDAFVYKDPCNVQKTDYQRYVEFADHPFDTTDKVLYWSGNVYPFIVEYANDGKRYATIRDTLMAYAIKSIDNWCGQVESPGINYKSCPEWGTCPNLTTTSFWRMLSRHFASKVKGTVHLMLNASSPVAYNNFSIFAKSELANLDRIRTPAMHVHLVSNLDQKPRETCNSGSLLQLREDVEKRSIKFICSEKEKSIFFFQCTNADNSKACDVMALTLSSTATSHLSLINIKFLFLLTAIVLFGRGC